MGVKSAVVEAWEKGGAGAEALAKIVVEEADKCSICFKPLYDFNWPIEKKIETVAKKIYGAADVEYSLKARKQLKVISDLKLDILPVCIAKTQKSLSDNPRLKNRPEGFIVNIRDIEIAAGAGFIVPIAGDIMRMPGLPKTPSAETIDIDAEGNISGLF
jgi:formate--tetrahydrofolate ligase